MRILFLVGFSLALSISVVLLMRSLINSNQHLVPTKPIATDIAFVIEPTPSQQQQAVIEQPQQASVQPMQPTPPIPMLSIQSIASFKLSDISNPQWQPLTPDFAQINPAIKQETMQVAISKNELALSSEAVVLLRVDPRYPQRALQRQIEGEVTVEFIINQQGKAEQIKIIQAQPKNIFNRNTITAVKKSKYKPVIDNGKFLPIKVKQTFKFTL